MLRVLARHPEPVNEIGWALTDRHLFWSWEEDHNELLGHIRRVRDLDVRAEVELAVRDVPPTHRVAVLGVGGSVPASLPDAVLVDFDRDLLDQVARSSGHETQHALGLRTQLPDQSVDLVVITSRLAGLWWRWDDQILAEAHRIGREVRCMFPLTAGGHANAS
jgi:hypothetical protein